MDARDDTEPNWESRKLDIELALESISDPILALLLLVAGRELVSVPVVSRDALDSRVRNSSISSPISSSDSSSGSEDIDWPEVITESLVDTITSVVVETPVAVDDGMGMDTVEIDPLSSTDEQEDKQLL